MKRMTAGDLQALELLMQTTPGFEHFDSGADGILPECRSCRFHRPFWKYQSCVFAECPYCCNPVSSAAFTNEIVDRFRLEHENGLVVDRIWAKVRKAAALFEEYVQTGKIVWKRVRPAPKIPLTPYYQELLCSFCQHEANKWNFMLFASYCNKSVSYTHLTLPTICSV